MNKYYLRKQGIKFGFVILNDEEVHPDVDIEISEQEYNTFTQMLQEGKQFRIKEDEDIKNGVFDILEVM
jgi:hypothetical protein